ncbi:MAG: hypothetical protein AAGJ40_00515 [Planctomycetota bacterium]
MSDSKNHRRLGIESLEARAMLAGGEVEWADSVQHAESRPDRAASHVVRLANQGVRADQDPRQRHRPDANHQGSHWKPDGHDSARHRPSHRQSGREPSSSPSNRDRGAPTDFPVTALNVDTPVALAPLHRLDPPPLPSVPSSDLAPLPLPPTFPPTILSGRVPSPEPAPGDAAPANAVAAADEVFTGLVVRPRDEASQTAASLDNSGVVSTESDPVPAGTYIDASGPEDEIGITDPTHDQPLQSTAQFNASEGFIELGTHWDTAADSVSHWNQGRVSVRPVGESQTIQSKPWNLEAEKLDRLRSILVEPAPEAAPRIDQVMPDWRAQTEGMIALHSGAMPLAPACVDEIHVHLHSAIAMHRSLGSRPAPAEPISKEMLDLLMASMDGLLPSAEPLIPEESRVQFSSLVYPVATIAASAALISARSRRKTDEPVPVTPE